METEMALKQKRAGLPWRALASPLLFVAMIVIFTVLRPGYLTAISIKSVLVQTSFLGIISIGLTLVMMTGGVDMSNGYAAGLGAIGGMWFVVNNHMSIGMGLLIAWLLDTIPEPTRYMIVFFIGGGIGVLDMLCFGFAKEVYTVPPKKLEFKTVVRDLLHDKPFMRFMIMWTAWCFTAQMSGVYLAPYAMQVMRLSAMRYMIYATIAAAVSTVLFIRYWGIAMDRFGCRSVMFATCIVAALTPAFYLLQTPGSIWPTLLHNFIGAAFWSGSNLASNSMQLSSSPDKYRPTYIAVFSCVTALLGNALGPLFGGAILDTCARHNWFTGSFDRYKFMILLSVILRLLFVLLFVPKLKNDRPVTFRDMLRAMALRHEAEQAQKAAGKE